MASRASLARRLTSAVLLLEFVAAVVLIATVWDHERHVQFDEFKANLRAGANALFGSIQEAESKDGSIAVDRSALSLPSRAAFSVTDEDGSTLDMQGRPPLILSGPATFAEGKVHGETYLFYVLAGERTIDPGKPFAVDHHVRIVFGLPTSRVWHEVLEAVRFFAFATLILLGATALLLTWLIRRLLMPITQLALAADGINSENWAFAAPESSKQLIELAPLASAIEKSILRLQRSFEQQRRFTSDAAHELKTDLAIVKSSLQLLQMKRRTAEEYEQGVSLGLDDIKRLENTVQKMLTLARLEQAQGRRDQSCDFADVVLEAIAQCEPFAAYKQVCIAQQVVYERTAIPVSGEDALLLCSNVLMNALQYSPAAGKVEVEMTRASAEIILTVRDHGAGVAADDLPFLFDAFYRGDASRSRETGGTGLGLSICKAICDRAQGSIDIHNHPEGGAEVEIRLPILSGDSTEL
ncbi:sensor histidine kinase [Silvibacterium sp.]|uniref:sensor histidine kinase n=1 Tax=Silvibacterium sp. TaxID=1964179 RepID=UPI0039E4DED7